MTVYIQGKPVGEIDLGMNYLDRGQPAFAYLNMPRAIADSAQAPKKRGPKRTRLEHALISLDTPEQRKERQAQERAHNTALILKRNSYSDVGRNCPLQADRTNVITGRRITARHQ